jgi:hypothetical protein
MNLWQLWLDAMNDPVAKWVVIIFLLISLILSAIYVAKWFRDLAIGGQDFASSISHNLAEIEKLYAERKISTEEYQRLKKVVPQQLVAKMGRDSTKREAVPQPEFENLKPLNNLNQPGQNQPGQNQPQQNPFNLNQASDDSDEAPVAERPDFKPAE